MSDLTIGQLPQTIGQAPQNSDGYFRTTVSRIKGHLAVFGNALLFPFLLLTAFLFAVGILMGWMAHGHHERALLYALYGNAGMPIALYWSSETCHAASGKTSVGRLNHADLLALLEAK